VPLRPLGRLGEALEDVGGERPEVERLGP
jgi:hypothetical protein